MCFSAQADVLGGVVVGAIGVDTIRHVRRRRGHVLIAALPLLLAWHQLDEAFVWWGLQGHVSAGVGRVATWLYLLFAFVVLPVYIPAAVLALEPPGRRRSWIVDRRICRAGSSGVDRVARGHGARPRNRGAR